MKAILHKLFPYAPYLNEYIGFEDEVGECETPLQAVERLRKYAEQSHKERYPHLYTEDGSPTITKQEDPIEQRRNADIEEIRKCAAIDEKNGIGVQVGLLSYKEKAEADPIIKAEYDLMYNKLSKQ